jgi:hypothetical protein
MKQRGVECEKRKTEEKRNKWLMLVKNISKRVRDCVIIHLVCSGAGFQFAGGGIGFRAIMKTPA